VILLPDEGWQPEHVSGTARHLASHGFVVAAPTVPSGTPAVQADALLSLLRAIDERSGVVARSPLLRCLSQQEVGGVVLMAHGRRARLALEVETRYEHKLHALPRVIWLSPVLDPVELGLRTPANQLIPGSFDADAEHPPGLAPAELLLTVDDERCGGDGVTFFERTRVSRSRFAATVAGASHCSPFEPGSPACVAACGAGSARARVAFQAAVTAWLLAQQRDPQALAPELGAELEEIVAIEDAEDRPAPHLPLPLQFSASLLLGVGVGLDGEGIPDTGFAAGGRPALVYGRVDDGYFGVGAYGEVLTAGLDDVQVGGGLELVVPLYAGFVLAPSAGALAWHRDDLGWSPAVTAGGFLGFRDGHGGNFLDPAYGFRVDGRFGLDDRADRALLVTFQGDVISAVAGLAAAIAWSL
jgi:hypothetical protein